MSKNTALIQDIKPPLYTFGDLVKYTIDFDSSSYTYYCQVIGLIWCIDNLDKPGYWEYTVQQMEYSNGRLTKIHIDYDTVNESELIVWQDSTELLSV